MAKKKEKPIVLDAEEQAIEDALNANFDNLESLGGTERYVEMAKAQVKRMESRITLRVSKSDAALLRGIAAKKGISYETLAGSIIHQFVTGQLVEPSKEIERLTKALIKATKSLQSEKSFKKRKKS